MNFSVIKFKFIFRYSCSAARVLNFDFACAQLAFCFSNLHSTFLRWKINVSFGELYSLPNFLSVGGIPTHCFESQIQHSIYITNLAFSLSEISSCRWHENFPFCLAAVMTSLLLATHNCQLTCFLECAVLLCLRFHPNICVYTQIYIMSSHIYSFSRQTHSWAFPFRMKFCLLAGLLFCGVTNATWKLLVHQLTFIRIQESVRLRCEWMDEFLSLVSEFSTSSCHE